MSTVTVSDAEKSGTPDKTVKPNGNRLFIKPLPHDSISSGGIHIAEQANRNMEVRRGEVIAVGPGMYTHEGKRIAMPFKPGDVVLYPRTCGHEVVIRMQSYLIVTEPDILGIEVAGKLK